LFANILTFLQKRNNNYEKIKKYFKRNHQGEEILFQGIAYFLKKLLRYIEIFSDEFEIIAVL